MLKPTEIAVGSFAEAAQGELTLMLPRRSSEEPILITRAGGEKIAVYLGQHKFSACPCGGSDAWKGLLLAGVSIEVDETSLFDPDYEDPPFGSLVRGGTSLSVIAKMLDNHHINRPQPVALVGGLAPCPERYSAGFRKWQIVLGEAEEKRVVFPVDVTRSS